MKRSSQRMLPQTQEPFQLEFEHGKLVYKIFNCNIHVETAEFEVISDPQRLDTL